MSGPFNIFHRLFIAPGQSPTSKRSSGILPETASPKDREQLAPAASPASSPGTAGLRTCPASLLGTPASRPTVSSASSLKPKPLNLKYTPPASSFILHPSSFILTSFPRVLASALLACLACLSPASAADTAYAIPFQGRITNQQGVPYVSGQYTLVFNLYSVGKGGTSLWSERHEKVPVTNGIISVILGSKNALPTNAGSPPVAFFSTTRYLGITVDVDDNTATADPEMLPRQMIIPAFHTRYAEKMVSPAYGNFGFSALFGEGVNPGESSTKIPLAKIPPLTLNQLPDNIPASKLAPTAALDNLTASGGAGLTAGSIVFSPTANNTSLINAGYAQIGAGQIGEGWKQLPIASFLTGREISAFVWTGSKLIVWGGQNQSGRLNDGGIYDPTSGTWSQISNVNAPSPRRYAGSVWTGSEFVVWGGQNGTTGYADGGVYNPVSNTWAALPTSPLAARTTFAMVWTGSEILIWGGESGSGTPWYNDGARLKKVGNVWTWSAMSLTNGPSGRSGPAYTWTGSELLIWGGWSGSILATGARYNPTNDSWTTISTSGAPTARNELSPMVWTGSEAIVWGGWNGSSAIGDGARYSPTTNQWTALPSLGAPTSRRSFASAWMGQEMFIWGGNNGGSQLSTGANYSPTSNLWIPNTQVNSPTARSNSLWPWSVWTGESVLLFGGAGGGTTYLNDLWSYTPPRTLYFYQKQ